MPLLDPPDITDLRTQFDAKTSTLNSLAMQGRKDQTRFLRLTTLSDTDVLSSRRIAFVMTDDMELRATYLHLTDVVAGRVVTAALTVDGGDTRFLGDVTVSLSLTSINGTNDTRGDFRADTGDRLRLKKGVRYIWTLTNTSAGTTTGVVVAGLQLRSIRRAA